MEDSSRCDYLKYLGLSDLFIYLLSRLFYSTVYRQLLLCHVDEVERCVEECIQEVGEAQAEHQEICHAPHFRVL